MTVIMSEKHQVTIPKKIASILNLKKGSLFNVEVRGNRIELIPLEVREKALTADEYRKLDLLVAKEKGKTKPVTKEKLAQWERGIA